MKRVQCVLSAFLVMASLMSLPISARAADYSFSTDGTPDYYPTTSYEEVYGSRYNYGGSNLVDYQIPELPYGSFSTTQIGIMEKGYLSGLQEQVSTGIVTESYGISTSETIIVPGTSGGNSSVLLPGLSSFTNLTDDFLLSNGAIGRISIPAIGVKNYYLWEGETTTSMKKGLGHFTDTSVWDGNVGICGHNRGAAYSIGKIKDLEIGDTITYTTTEGTRTYKVESITIISSTDWTYLEATSDNRITLITCLADQPDKRVCVQGVQVSS